MLVACRLAGLSALEAYYAGLKARTQFGPTQRSSGQWAMADCMRSGELGRNVRRRTRRLAGFSLPGALGPSP